MTIIPHYDDLSSSLNLQKGELPFHIAIHYIPQATMLHHHDFAEFSYVIEGSGTEYVNGKAHRLRPGVASFMLPHHMHELRSDAASPVRKFCCMFDINILLGTPFDSDWCGLLYDVGSKYPSGAEFSGDEAKRLHELFGKLLLESTRSPQEPGRDSMIRALLLEALILFLRAVRVKQAADEWKKPGLPETFWPILQYVHVHYTDSLSLESLADRFHVSAPYISRSFKQYTGKSFLRYLHQLRIDSAVNLLLATDMAITDISAEIGFESFRTFSRVFQSLKGMSPRAFRNLHKPAERDPLPGPR